jgi:hypothetical protein
MACVREGRDGQMESEGRRAAPDGAYGRPYGTPYVAAVELKAAAEPEPVKLEGAFQRWVRPIGDYERRETTIVEGLRYG